MALEAEAIDWALAAKKTEQPADALAMESWANCSSETENTSDSVRFIANSVLSQQNRYHNSLRSSNSLSANRSRAGKVGHTLLLPPLRNELFALECAPMDALILAAGYATRL